MKCIYCGEELEYEDSYGNKEYIIYGYENGKMGDIYKCPNHEGFKTLEEAMVYANTETNQDFEEYLSKQGWSSWEDVSCESTCHNVSGSFHTNKYDDLMEGYPC